MLSSVAVKKRVPLSEHALTEQNNPRINSRHGNLDSFSDQMLNGKEEFTFNVTLRTVLMRLVWNDDLLSIQAFKCDV